MVCFMPQGRSISHRAESGVLKPQSGYPSLCGQQRGGRFKLMIVLEREGSYQLTGAAYVGVARRQTICYFIVILLMQCGVIFCLFGDSWVMPRIVIDLLFGWCNRFGKQSSAVQNLASLCLMWLLWRGQHYLTFEDVEAFEMQLKIIFLDYFVNDRLSRVQVTVVL